FSFQIDDSGSLIRIKAALFVVHTSS
ncbi:hypothetical protein A2U01_0111101, partial [Trifolium medium]|nr:hypothetical protein [Trifolium medium]